MLSAKSKEFLTNLRVYLTTYGKNEQEIQAIVSELEDHLIQAEKQGKSIEQVTGGSPKAYMDSLRKEMRTDLREIQSILLLFFPLALAFIVLPDALKNQVSFSWFKIIGNLSTLIIALLLFTVLLRWDSSKNLTKWSRRTLYWIVGIVPFGLFLGIHFFDYFYAMEPVFVASTIQNISISIGSIVFLIAYAIWAKTWAP